MEQAELVKRKSADPLNASEQKRIFAEEYGFRRNLHANPLSKREITNRQFGNKAAVL